MCRSIARERAVLARITELSCERLGLKSGTPVFAIIKTVALEPY